MSSYVQSRNSGNVYKTASVLDDASWAHPVVVIDPEDAEQIARLARVFADWPDECPVHDVHLLAGALREFAAPAEPELTVSPVTARAMRDALARLDREEGRR